jgi:hypothetical protein
MVRPLNTLLEAVCYCALEIFEIITILAHSLAPIVAELCYRMTIHILQLDDNVKRVNIGVITKVSSNAETYINATAEVVVDGLRLVEVKTIAKE